MARVRLCVCGSWFVGREGQAAHPRAPGQCLHFECRGAPARVRVWRCEGRPPLPHHFVCVEKFTLPYLTLPQGQAFARPHMPRHIIIFLICVCGASVDGVPTSLRHHTLRYTPLCPSTVPRFAAVRLRERDWQARARGGRPRVSDRGRASSNASQRPLRRLRPRRCRMALRARTRRRCRGR